MSGAAVIDASVALNLLLSEAGAAVVRARLAAWRRSGVSIYIPSHFWLEVSNSLLCRHQLPASLVVAAIHHLDEFGLETVELSRPGVLLAVALAERHRLSLYDAMYLATAESVGGQLLTSDRNLLAAAGDRGLGVVGDDHRLSEQPVEHQREPTWPRYGEASAFLAKLRADVQSSSRDRGRTRGVPAS